MRYTINANDKGLLIFFQTLVKILYIVTTDRRENSGLKCRMCWIRAGYGERTSGWLYKNACVHEILDLGAGWFESATVDTNIITYEKSREVQTAVFAQTLSRKLENISEGKALAPKNSITMNAKGDSFIILSATEKAILDKMNSIGKPLKEWDISINYGIKTGFNEAFIIDGATKDSLIKEDSKSEEIIKPLLRGRDIKRYSYEFADKWLINTHNGVKSKDILPINIDNYPAVKKHLDNYKNQLEKRQDKGDTPYNLRSCAYLEDFEKPKIVWTPVNGIYSFTYIKGSVFCNNSIFMGVGNHLEYLCAVLNVVTVKMGKLVTPLTSVGQYAYGSKEYIERIPIPTPTKEQENQITKLVQNVLKNKTNNIDTSDLEKEIDIIVYGLYNLSDEEIFLIENK